MNSPASSRESLRSAPARRLDHEGLLRLAMEIGASLDPTEVVRTILAGSARLAGADRATLSSWRESALTIEATADALGGGDVTWPGRSYDISWATQQPLIHEALKSGTVVFGGALDARSAAPEFREALLKVRHTATVPLVHEGSPTGLLLLSRFSDPSFEEADRSHLKTLGAIAGLALRNAHMHQETRDAARRLEAARDTRSAVMDMGVHELRTPIGVISGYASLLVSGDLGRLEPAALKAVEVITRKAGEAQDIVTALLTLFRLESDALIVERNPFALARLLLGVAERAGPRAELTGSRITVTCPPDLLVEGDATLTGHVLTNLINNALNYAEPRRAIEVSAVASEGTVTIRVSDQGIGIAEEDWARIFERFVRGPGSERAPGTGLGLYLSRECARRMRGDLVLESSRLGKGSTFALNLPGGNP